MNLPDQALGKRLKCPKCGNKFTRSVTDESSPSSTYVLPSTGQSPSLADMGSGTRPVSNGELIPTAASDLRETFDLPLLNEVAAGPGPVAVGATKPAADALALFDDGPPKSKRRTTGAEARAKARRCPTCGGVVPPGMSLCSSCGLDLETGVRVALDDDIGPPPPPPQPSMPIAIGVIGGISFLGSLICTVATLAMWLQGHAGLQYFTPLALFGIFASVQFIRRKSVKLLMIAMTFGLAIDIFALIALPIYIANNDTAPIARSEPVNEPEESDVVIPSVVDRLDTQSLTLGIVLIGIYAGVSVYLMSPQVRRYFR